MNVFKDQYPPQTGIYKVIVKNTSKWKEYNTCRLQVSVGHGDKHEGEKFAASLNWAKDRFEKVLVCVNDTLQRHNLLNKGMNEKTAYAMAYEAGNRWIKENIKAQDSKIEIIRWDYWLKHKDFNHYMALVNSFYNKNQEFKEGVYNTISGFLSRTEIDCNEYNKQQSIFYALEETAILPIMAKEHKAVDLYPGSPLPELKKIRDGKIEGVAPLENIVFTKIAFLKNTKAPE